MDSDEVVDGDDGTDDNGGVDGDDNGDGDNKDVDGYDNGDDETDDNFHQSIVPAFPYLLASLPLSYLI